jgi:16S rRNA (cytosine967-C5)-methyltransferase
VTIPAMHPKALLVACGDLIQRALKFDHPADAIVARFFRENKGLGPRERSLLTETLYNVLRKKQLFDHFAPSGSGPRERRMAILGFAAPRDFLSAALTEPEKAWLAACDAVKVEDLLERHQHNLPDWLASALKAQVGDEFPALARSLNDSGPLDLRVNALKAKRPEVQAELAQAAIKSIPTPYAPLGLRVEGKPSLNKVAGYLNGNFEVQDEGSQLLAMLVDAKRGEMVVDFCAGAGGKTLALGAAMRNSGRLYAFDTSAHRLDALKPRLARSGLSNVHPVAIAHERDDRIKRLAGKIDRVLVDAPCSGLGTLRRNPDLKWRIEKMGPGHKPGSPGSEALAAITEMAALQVAILRSAARLVKPGGRLVYATCSLLPEENEAVASAFNSSNPDFEPLPVARILAQLKAGPGPEQDAEPATSLYSDSGQLYLRLWPHRHQTDGFFSAVWTKK